MVSTADPKRTARLLDPTVLGPTTVWRTENIRQPGAAARMNLVLHGVPTFHGGDEERLAGRIVIGPSIDDVERAMDAVKYGHVAEEPILEATIPSLSDPSLAPEGTHVMTVVFQGAPRHLREGDWGTERDRVGEITVKTLERYAPGFGDLVDAIEVITPEDMERDHRLTGGDSSTRSRRSTSSSRGARCSGSPGTATSWTGLYLAGSGAHPGGGITGGPGANAAKRIIKDLKR